MNKKIIGDTGEKIISRYLKTKGYIITAQNYHSRFGEIDIIAENREVIAFVEVKTRRENSLSLPREAVDKLKQSKIRQTAMQYMSYNYCDDLQVRFDVAEITYIGDSYRINYIEGAF